MGKMFRRFRIVNKDSWYKVQVRRWLLWIDIGLDVGTGSYKYGKPLYFSSRGGALATAQRWLDTKGKTGRVVKYG